MESVCDDSDEVALLEAGSWGATVAEEEAEEDLVNVVNNVLETVDVTPSVVIKPVDMILVTEVWERNVVETVDGAVAVRTVHLSSSQCVVVDTIVDSTVEIETWELWEEEETGRVESVSDSGGSENAGIEDWEQSVVIVTEVILVVVESVHLLSSQCVVVTVVVDWTIVVENEAVLVKVDDADDTVKLSIKLEAIGTSKVEIVHWSFSQCVVVIVLVEKVDAPGISIDDTITAEDVSPEIVLVKASVVEVDCVVTGITEVREAGVVVAITVE